MIKNQKVCRLLGCNIFVLIFLLISSVAFSQNKISGRVQNAKNEVLAYANVTVYDTTATSLVAYAISDDTGHYNVELETGVYLFKVSFLGYKSASVTKKITRDEVIDFKLFEDQTSLEEVVIKTKSLDALINNDTIKYNLKGLTTGNEENLKEVLTKLPGVEINEKGKIEANGKQIDKLLIDGKDFFGDQHQLATENISAEMVEGVSLLQNFNDFSDLETQRKSGKTAMSIEIDEDYKGSVRGNITAGGGYQNKYELNANLFTFREKTNLFFIANANNIGNQTFTFEDYISFQGGIQKMISDNGSSSTVISGDDLPPYLLSGNEVKSKNEQLAALNFSYNPSKKFKLNSYIIFDRSNIAEEQFIKQTYFNDNQNIALGIDNNKNNTFLINNSFVDAIYKPSNNSIFEYIANFSPQYNDLMSNDNFNLRKYNTSREINNMSFNQALKFKKKLNKFILSSTVYHSVGNKKEKLNIASNDTFLSLLFLKNDYKALQNIDNYTGNYGLKTFAAVKTNRKSFLKLKYEISKRKETFQTDIENNPQRNDANLDVLEHKLGFNFYNVGKPLLNYYLGCDFSFINANEHSGRYSLPFANLKFNFADSHSLSMSYKRTLNLPQADNIIQDSYILNYNTLINNRNIKPGTIAKYDNFRLNYFIYDLFSGTFFTLGGDYIVGKDIVATNTLYIDDYKRNEYILGDFDSKTNAYLVLNKKFWKIPFKLSLKSSFSHIDSHNYIDEKPNKYTYDILNNNLGISSNFGESIFNFEFGYKNKQSYVSSKTIDTKSKLHLHQPYLNLFFDYLNFSLTVKSSIEFYRTSTLEKQLYTLSPNLSYKTKNKRWKFYIKGQDILNLNKNYVIENIAYNNYFEEKTVSTMGGFVIVGLAYKF